MSKTYEELANLDRLVHEPARLAILTVLAACAGADFLFLKASDWLDRWQSKHSPHRARNRRTDRGHKTIRGQGAPHRCVPQRGWAPRH